MLSSCTTTRVGEKHQKESFLLLLLISTCDLAEVSLSICCSKRLQPVPAFSTHSRFGKSLSHFLVLLKPVQPSEPGDNVQRQPKSTVHSSTSQIQILLWNLRRKSTRHLGEASLPESATSSQTASRRNVIFTNFFFYSSTSHHHHHQDQVSLSVIVYLAS